jgi:hypothetical protein
MLLHRMNISPLRSEEVFGSRGYKHLAAPRPRAGAVHSYNNTLLKPLETSSGNHANVMRAGKTTRNKGGTSLLNREALAAFVARI